MPLEISLALLAFSAPITAAIIVYKPHKNGNGNGDKVSPREFGEVSAKLDGLVKSVDEVKAEVSKIWQHIS